MISFILNNKTIQTDHHPGSTLLDFIRYKENLPGTKIGCREGDCGACTVLEGSLSENQVKYKSIVSCLTPLGNAHGKHIVTIEGLSLEDLSPIQKAMVDHSATQCGFCTPGFVTSLTGHAMSDKKSSYDKAIASISGNICRCTGYKSIERAAQDISELIKNKDIQNPITWMVNNNFLPEYFLTIKDRLLEIKSFESNKNSSIYIGGGTDLMVQKPEEIAEDNIHFIYHDKDLKQIITDKDRIYIGSACSASDIMNSPIIEEYFPGLKSHFRLISSEPIRNMGTIAGNFVNASPIGDLSIYFLALDANIIIKNSKTTREIPLRNFFLDYKKLDLKKEEYINSVSISMPKTGYKFNFEKVSKRTYLDIASVNTAIYIEMEKDVLKKCYLSAGGIGPIPKYLNETSVYLTGKKVTNGVIIKANEIMQKEITPISDVRGSKEYKRLLLRQLMFAHFIKLCPESISLNELIN